MAANYKETPGVKWAWGGAWHPQIHAKASEAGASSL